MKEDMFVSMYWARTNIISEKKTQEGNQSDHATQYPKIPMVKTTTVWEGTSSLVLHEALNTDS